MPIEEMAVREYIPADEKAASVDLLARIAAIVATVRAFMSVLDLALGKIADVIEALGGLKKGGG